MNSVRDELQEITHDLRERIRYEAEWGIAGHERDPETRDVPVSTLEAKPAAAPHRTSRGPQVAPRQIPKTYEPASPSVNTLPEVGEVPPGIAGLEHVRAVLGDCTRCPLHAGRKNLVFGRGNPEADLLFIGEGPGAREDEQGLPFVGPAGQLLDRMIAAMGLGRDDVYIANVVKCRPPRNRDPEIEERIACRPFLIGQMHAIGPRFIVTLGRVATQTVLETDERISRLRGRWRDHPHHPVQVMPTYHPAALLRNPRLRRPVWEDLQQVMDALGLQQPR